MFADFFANTHAHTYTHIYMLIFYSLLILYIISVTSNSINI